MPHLRRGAGSLLTVAAEHGHHHGVPLLHVLIGSPQVPGDGSGPLGGGVDGPGVVGHPGQSLEPVLLRGSPRHHWQRLAAHHLFAWNLSSSFLFPPPPSS